MEGRAVSKVTTESRHSQILAKQPTQNPIQEYKVNLLTVKLTQLCEVRRERSLGCMSLTALINSNALNHFCQDSVSSDTEKKEIILRWRSQSSESCFSCQLRVKSLLSSLLVHMTNGI